MDEGVGYFALVLHTHLPYVINHGRWPHGSDWISEAAIQSYIPILRTFSKLAQEGISPKATINLTPVLCEQLASEAFKKEIEGLILNRLKSCHDNRQYFAQTGQKELEGLTYWWEDYYNDIHRYYEQIDGDIVSGFRRLMKDGHLEITTCAATHGYLPLLSRDESIEFQIKQACQVHHEHFGEAPRGIWLPECAYRPTYQWSPPAGQHKGKRSYKRKGIEEFTAKQGLEYFFIDTHMALGGKPLSVYKDFFPELKRLVTVEDDIELMKKRQKSPYRTYIVASKGGTGHAIAFTRDPRTTVQVWSRGTGYPGDEWYLEFHKKHFPGGLRFWRVTHPKSDLGAKKIYEPQKALARLKEHARHFAVLVRNTLKEYNAKSGQPGVVCSPYDSELFGHWWFEGPDWLYYIYKELDELGVGVTTCWEYINKFPSKESISLSEGSWGEGGDHRVWLNQDTLWTWDKIYDAEEEMWGLIEEIKGRPIGYPAKRAIEQAARELLLLQSSDWQFLITTWSARDYAEMRFVQHYTNFKQLMQIARKALEERLLSSSEQDFLARLERQDFIFPNVALPI